MNPWEATVPVGDQRLRTEPTGLFFEEADGTSVWKRSLLPITVPTVAGSLVVLGVNTDDGPEVWAFDLTTGDLLWQRPMEGDVVAAGPAHVVTTRRPDVVEIGDFEGRVATTTHVGATVGDVLVDDEHAYVSIYRGAAAIDLITGELLWWYSAAVER